MNVDHPAPLLLGNVLGKIAKRQTGVVEQRVEQPYLPLDLHDQGHDRGTLRHVDRHAGCHAAAGADVGRCRRGLFAIQIGDDHVHSPSDAPRCGKANSARAARDQEGSHPRTLMKSATRH